MSSIQTQATAAARPAGISLGRLLPYLALVFSVAAMATSAIFVKWANAPGSLFGMYRMVLAVAVTAIPMSLQARRSTGFSRRHLWYALLGGLFLALDLWVWNNGALITSAANAMVFGNTSVFWVAIGGVVLFHERLRPVFWGGLVLALVGVLVILGNDFFAHPTLGVGDLMTLLGGFFYGAFFIATARAREKLSAFVAWWISSLASAVVLLAVSLAMQIPMTGYPLQTYLCIIGAGLLTQVGGYLALSYALGHIPASVVSPTLLAQPVFTAIMGIFLLGQPITVEQILGGALILGGILVVHQTNQKT